LVEKKGPVTRKERPQRAALSRFLRATKLAKVPEAAPVVEQLRALADELDEGGGQRPRAEYRQYLKLAMTLHAQQVKKLAPVTAEGESLLPSKKPAATKPKPDPKPSPGEAVVTGMDRFLQERGAG
jgi:hypothetical protein